MKFSTTIKIALLLTIVFGFQTSHAAQPATTGQGSTLDLNFVQDSNSMASLPAVQLEWIYLQALNAPQTPDVQDAVYQIVQNAFANFSSLDARGQNKLLNVYNQLVTSPLLNSTQQAYLQNTIIPTVTPMVQPMTAANSALTPVEQQAQALQQKIAGNTAASGGPQAATSNTIASSSDASTVAPSVVDATSSVSAESQAMTQISQTTIPTTVSVSVIDPTAPINQLNNSATVQQDGIASPAPITVAAISAITQNTQMTNAAQAASLANLISNAPSQTSIDPTIANTIGQAVQTIYNAQTSGDAPAIASLLQAAIQKSVITPDQVSYVQSTLLPAIKQQITQNPTATANINTAVISPSLTQATTPNASSTNTVAALPGDDIINTIKGLYAQMQQNQTATVDTQIQASFGASLVEVFTQATQIQSFMIKLLKAAKTTALLDAAQQAYVVNTMIPGLNQVTNSGPTKTLDQAIAQDKAKGIHHGKKAHTKNTTKMTTTSTKPTKKKGKKHKYAKKQIKTAAITK